MKRLVIAFALLLCIALLIPTAFTALQSMQLSENNHLDIYIYSQPTTVSNFTQPNGPGSGGGGGGTI